MSLRIAIVGGGASGMIAAMQLLEHLGSELSLTIFDPAQELGSGLAYGTKEKAHLLNVPADRMGISETNASDFLSWLKEAAPFSLLEPHYPFVPRYLYRNYLQARWREMSSRYSGHIAWKRETVRELRSEGESCFLRTDVGCESSFDFCFVATGFEPQCDLSALRWTGPRRPEQVQAGPYYHTNDLAPAASVVIVGAGLTAIDIWRQLRQQGHNGKITFLSRRGHFPIPHPESTPARKSWPLPLGTPREALLHARVLFLQNGWSAAEIADSLRVEAGSLWKRWSPKERAQFLRHLRPYWDQIRHRVPPLVYRELESEISRGLAEVHAARILGTSLGQGEEVMLRALVKGEIREWKAERLFVATGAPIRQTKVDASPDRLFLVGPASREQSWEITAIPEIRRQVGEIIIKIGAGVAKAERVIPSLRGEFSAAPGN